MAKDLAIVLNNGSINSAVAAALAAQRHRLIMMYVDVAGIPGARGRAAYDQQVAHFKPYREHSVGMPFLSGIQPAGPDASAAASDPRVPTVLTPQMVRLVPLMGAAVSFAVHYQATAIYLGLRVGGTGDELSQATEFAQIWNQLIQLPCGQPEVEVQTPLLELDAWQVVDVGANVAAPFDRTWSCQEESNEPCWACRGCRAREAAFQQAGKPDPMRGVRKL